MREILFRGMTPKGFWAWGDLRTVNRPEICVGGYEVLPETVGQYTGLLDVTDKPIFEGDIVRDSYGCVWEVIHDSSICAFVAKNETGICLFGRMEALKVIGNIYDSPELLNN